MTPNYTSVHSISLRVKGVENTGTISIGQSSVNKKHTTHKSKHVHHERQKSQENISLISFGAFAIVKSLKPSFVISMMQYAATLATSGVKTANVIIEIIIGVCLVVTRQI